MGEVVGLGPGAVADVADQLEDQTSDLYQLFAHYHFRYVNCNRLVVKSPFCRRATTLFSVMA
jgi:hypothetical protein